MNFRGFVTFILICFIVLLIALLLLFRLPREAILKFLRAYIKMSFKILGIKLNVLGMEKLTNCGSCVFISNHSSLFDIPVLKVILPFKTYFVAKEELFKIPILSYVLQRLSVIALDRQNKDKAISSLDNTLELLKHGIVSLWIAPEGTRNLDGKLLPFKKGAFYTALKAKVPILPITICGTWDVLKKGSLKVYKKDIVVFVKDPVIVDEEKHINEIIESVWNCMLEDINNYKKLNNCC